MQLIKMKSSNQLKQVVSLREKLVELEHNQWIYWSKSIANTNSIPEIRLNRWKKLWKPYNKLLEKDKEQDRTWADKVLKILKKGGYNSSHD